MGTNRYARLARKCGQSIQKKWLDPIPRRCPEYACVICSPDISIFYVHARESEEWHWIAKYSTWSKPHGSWFKKLEPVGSPCLLIHATIVYSHWNSVLLPFKPIFYLDDVPQFPKRFHMKPAHSCVCKSFLVESPVLSIEFSMYSRLSHPSILNTVSYWIYSFRGPYHMESIMLLEWMFKDPDQIPSVVDWIWLDSQ